MTRTQRVKQATICHVLHSLSVGGAELLSAKVGRSLSDEFRIVFACLDEAGAQANGLQSDGFTVHVIGRSPGVDFGCARRLSRFLRTEHVHLVHAHQYTPFFYAVMPGLYRRRPPVLFTEHGRHFPDVPRRRRMVFNRICLRPGDRVAAVGKSVRRALAANEGINARRIAVIYNGADLPCFSEYRERRSDMRCQLGIEDSVVCIIQVARLDPLKDHFTAIRTMARLQRQSPETQLLLVGEGTERRKIEDEIVRHQLSDSVRLLGYRPDVPRLLAAADMMLLTSLSEGIPVTLIEAMAAGLPIVATKVGGVSEVVQHGVSGYLAPAADDAALADAAFKLVSDPLLRERMGSHGARRAQDVFSEQRMLNAYRDLYREMLTR